jgi:soluble lytic murein transglycosylase
LQSLKEIPGFEKRAALLFTYGEILAGADREKESIKILRDVYFGFPLSTKAEPAKAVLLALQEQMGASYPEASVALWRERAEYLWVERAYIGARAAYQTLGDRQTGQAKQGALLRATASLYYRGSRRAACRELKAVGVVPEVFRGEKRALQARCAVRAGNWEDAQNHLAYLALKYPAAQEYETALRATADTAWVRGERARAIQYYQQYRLAFPKSPAAAVAHWRFAWAVYSEGDAAGAAQLLEKYATNPAPSSLRSRALYWRARLALEEKQEALAQHLFTKAVANTPRDYLAQQAQAHLAQLTDPTSDGKVLPEWAGKIPARKNIRPVGALPASLQPRVNKAVALNHLGLEEMASRELEAGLVKNPHPALWLEAARLSSLQGDYRRAAENTRRAFPRYLTADLDELPREAWELLFPLPYWDVIRRESERRGVDPFLVAGLIRQESRFDKEAVSSVGALGLMQLMPATARYLDRNRRLSREQIQEPERNIRLGVLHLSQLLGRFDGDVEKAVAAYNGGGTRVARWAKELPADTPAFVESIPLEQTRNFVYIVLRNYQFYRDLYGGGEAPVIQRSRSTE